MLVVGESGSGKSALIDQILLRSWVRNEFPCGCIHYNVGAEDSFDSTVRVLLEDAFHTARSFAGAIENPGIRYWQWLAFFENLKIKKRKLEDINHLINFLRFDPEKHFGEQLLGRLREISRMTSPEARAIVLIDRAGPLPLEFAEQWKQIALNLPPKVKLVFSQLPDDPFVKNEEFRARENVHVLPVDRPQGLGPLLREEFEALCKSFEKELGEEQKTGLEELFSLYQGNPYLIRAAFNMLQYKPSMVVADLPQSCDPNLMAEKQWNYLCEMGDDVVRLFRAYAFLEVTVPDEIAAYVADLDLFAFRKALNDPYVRSLLRNSSHGLEISDRPLIKRILEETRTEAPFGAPLDYHRRAISTYYSLLQRCLKTDAFSAARIPEHTLHVGGPYAFARSAGEMSEQLLSIKHYETAIRLVRRGLEAVPPGSQEAGQLRFRLAQVFKERGDVDAARACFTESLKILDTYGDLDVRPDVLLELGKMALEEENFTAAAEYFQESHHLCVENLDPLGKVDAMALLGVAQWNLEGEEAARRTLKAALELCEGISYYRDRTRAKANVLCVYGKLLEAKKDYDAASQYFMKALECTQDLYDRAAEAEIYTNLRVLLEKTGGLKDAAQYQKKALQIHESLRDLEAMAYDHRNLFQLYTKLGDTELAQPHRESARKLYEQLGDLEKAREMETPSAQET